MQLPVVPVIDINKLPRYGVLAPPIERPEKEAGKHVDLDRATQVFVKNRGALREAAEGKSGIRHQPASWMIESVLNFSYACNITRIPF